MTRPITKQSAPRMTQETTMIEKVARAISPESFERLDRSEQTCSQWEDDYGGLLFQARAALEAMREHTLVFRDDGMVVHELRGSPDDIWKAMIDAALAEGASDGLR